MGMFGKKKEEGEGLQPQNDKEEEKVPESNTEKPE